MSKAKTVRVRCPNCNEERTLTSDKRTGLARGRVARCRPCAMKARSAACAAVRAQKAATPCRHCGGGPVNRPRGLCWTCFTDKAVRALYPSTSKYARRGVASAPEPAAAPVPLAPAPTYADPGSARKVEVMERRAKLGQPLFVPGDIAIVIESWLGRSDRALGTRGGCDAAN